MKRTLLLLQLFAFSLQPIAAQPTESALAAESTQLKGTFKEAEIAATKSTTGYTFFIDPNTGLKVREKQLMQVLSLKSHATLILRNFFNDHISIESYTLENEKGKNLFHNKYCGHTVSPDIFYSDGQVCVYQSTFPFPGQYAKYDASILYTDAKYLTQVFFHDEIPAKVREISFVVPDGIDIELVEMNFNNYNIGKKVTKQAKATTYTYTLLMAEPFPKDKNLPGSLHFLPHLLVLCKSYQDSKGTRQPVLSSTDDLYRWYASLTSRLNTNYETLKPTVTELIRGLTTDEEKIRAIYYWVQDNIKYIAFEDGVAAFKPKDASEVFYKRYGDCKGMANLMKGMMIEAGFDARLTWIGTDRIPYTYSLPTLAVDNHMICTVFNHGKQYILDATEKYNSFGSYAERIQGKEILIENGSTYLLSKVPEEPLDRYLEESLWQLKVVDKTLQGNGDAIIIGEHKKDLLYFLSSLKKEDQEKFLKEIVAGKADPAEFLIRSHSSLKRDSSLRIRSQAILKNQLYSNSNEIYLDVDFDDAYKDSQMEKDRKTPYKFSRRAFKKLRTELTIPKGYRLSYLPEPLHIKNIYYEFDLFYEALDNKVVYNKEIRILKSTLPVTEFAAWNKAIQDVKNFYNNQVILKENE